MRRFSLLIALAALAALGSCRDATGPELGHSEAAGTAPWAWHMLADRTGDGVGDSRLNILRQSPSAPPLETYRTSFEACRNSSRTLRIRYQRLRSGQYDERRRARTDAFLELTVPRGSLSRWPDGSRFRWSDCVTITVAVDPHHMVASFEPAGLKFSGSNPTQLRLWYAEANPDYNGDGVVDRRDQEIEDHALSIWRLSHSSEPWQKIGAVQYRDAKRFEAELYEFSHYAVAH